MLDTYKQERPATWLQEPRSTIYHRFLVARRSRALTPFKRFARRPDVVVGLVVFAIWVAIAIAWPLIAPYSPTDVHLLEKFRSPSLSHLFGTDNFGRDIFSRVLAGSRTVLVVSMLASALGIGIGTTLGLLTGFYGGLIDEVIMRIIDTLMALPSIVLAIIVLAVAGPSLVNVILVIALVYIPLNCRIIRSAVLVQRNQDFIAAARLRGENGFHIMFVEILPNITSTLVVEFTVRVAYAAFTVSTLSFLGLGIQPPTPDWGLMISEGRIYIQIAPWIVIFPAAALATLVLSTSLIGEGIKK